MLSALDISDINQGVEYDRHGRGRKTMDGGIEKNVCYHDDPDKLNQNKIHRDSRIQRGRGSNHDYSHKRMRNPRNIYAL